MSAVEKRMYYLMLSPSQGQEFAESMGFSTPSEDVNEAETYDIISRWALLASAGVMEEAMLTSDWLLEISDFDVLDEEMKEQLKKLIVAHTMSFTNKLLDSDKLALITLIEMDDDDYE